MNNSKFAYLAIKNLNKFDKIEYRSGNIPQHPMITSEMGFSLFGYFS